MDECTLLGLSPMELGRLRMSVGYGGIKKDRPLSPLEVSALVDRIVNAGVSLEDCAAAIGMKGATQVRRFLLILNLPQYLKRLIHWGDGDGGIGFSAAVELARLRDKNDQRVVAEAILVERLTSKETARAVRRKTETEKPMDACVQEVLSMRYKTRKRYVFIGSVADPDVSEALGNLSWEERDAILKSGIRRLGLKNASGRLDRLFFTLSGNEAFEASMRRIGKETIEERLRDCITEALQNTSSSR